MLTQVASKRLQQSVKPKARGQVGFMVAQAAPPPQPPSPPQKPSEAADAKPAAQQPAKSASAADVLAAMAAPAAKVDAARKTKSSGAVITAGASEEAKEPHHPAVDIQRVERGHQARKQLQKQAAAAPH